ncbi:Transposon Ty3-I Gag-Pol polyprotein [Vitis vinifera]|uniref:Transposon Ty3-I Gag-Pol polyprotein n=1 Tax=Vitis vinifera TaxID=29760 RepID=A0A438BZ69_VITVI|nr:Transposon Ty3-I Gag-Pol polyprotein [Vitis vinifera]
MPKTPQSKGLMYVEALVNGKATKALVDTGATHNFVSEDEARRLELQASKEGGWLKAVNSTAKPSHGVARRVAMHISSWEGRVDFTVAPMDDFKMVLGMDFLQKVKAVPLPFLRIMAILEEEKPCMVPTVTEGTLKTPMLSAMQVKKGLKRKEVTYLATLKEERDDGSGEPMPKEIKGVLDEFKDVMPPELPKRLPPRREEDHKIELEPGAKPPAMGPYRMAPPELEELRRQLKELLDAGFIQPSKAPYGAPVLFQKKHDGSLRMCIDYRALNKVTGKVLHEAGPKVGLLPSKDCGGGRAEDYMCNQLDDIVIYSNTLKEHVEHLRKVFKILRQNELYVKKEKCSFAREEVRFLGHRIRDGKLMMDDSKMKAIQEWDPPTKGYSAKAAPLTDLLKKNKAWEWDERCQQAFEDLKKVVTEEPVLALPDHTKAFEVHIDASNFAIRGVFMQERHLIAFESHKLNDTERRYTVQEKEMTAIVHCLHTWRHYLLGSHFIVKTDNVATSYF